MDTDVGTQTYCVETYCVELDSFCMEHGELEDSPEAREVSVKVRSLYDAGVALFSKEAIRNVAQQLNGGSQTITVHGLDAVPVTFERKTGHALMDDEEYDWIIGDPFIRFSSIQALCSHSQGYAPGLSLCSIWIYHYLTKRKKSTDQLVSPIYIQPRDEVLEFFRTQRELWMGSDACKELRSGVLTRTNFKVTKIIAFACGGMAFYDRVSNATRSAYQHALILTLMDVLTEIQTPSDPIRCYAQDPIYSEVDRGILDSYGICVLDNPQGFLEVDDSTAVLSFAANIPVRQVVAEISRPAIMIWNECVCLSNELEDSTGTDPDSPRLVSMIKTQYDEIKFPGCLKPFAGIKIYIKKGSST